MALSIKTLHTHTHTHTHTHVQTHTHRYTQTQMCAHRHTRTCTHTETHAHTHKPTCTHTETLTYAHPHRHTHAHTHTHTRTRAHAPTQTHTHTHTHTDIHAHARAHTHTDRHTCACACTHTHTTLSIITEVYIVLTLVLFSLHSVWQEQNQIHWLQEAAPVLLHGWVTREPQSLSSHFLEANSCQARRHDWNPPTERRSQVLCLKKAACFISDLLGWNLKRKTEGWLGILNGHLITLATVQGRRCSKKDGRQDANQGVWYLWLSSWINEIQYLSRRKG